MRGTVQIIELQKKHQKVTALKSWSIMTIYLSYQQYNISSERLNLLAIGYTAPYLESIISPTALKLYEIIPQYLSRKWDEDLTVHPQLLEMKGCLEKLATSILQIERLSNHQNQLLSQAIDASKDLDSKDAGRVSSQRSFIRFRITSFAEQSSALDGLTNLISRHYGYYTDSFPEMRKKYKIQKGRKNRIHSQDVGEAKWFEGKHIEDNSQNNLRSFVAHKQSILKRLERYFQVHYASRDQFHSTTRIGISPLFQNST